MGRRRECSRARVLLVFFPGERRGPSVQSFQFLFAGRALPLSHRAPSHAPTLTAHVHRAPHPSPHSLPCPSGPCWARRRPAGGACPGWGGRRSRPRSAPSVFTRGGASRRRGATRGKVCGDAGRFRGRAGHHSMSECVQAAWSPAVRPRREKEKNTRRPSPPSTWPPRPHFPLPISLSLSLPGAYQVLPERRPRYIVPDLSACEVRKNRGESGGARPRQRFAVFGLARSEFIY